MRTAIALSPLRPLLICSCPSVLSFSRSHLLSSSSFFRSASSSFSSGRAVDHVGKSRRGRSPHTAASLASSMDALFTQKPSTSRLVARARRTLLAELQDIKDEKNVAGPLEYESPLRIVLYPDPKLRAKNKRITVFDEKLEKLAKEMFEVMYETDGVGLSAPQVGVNVQLMVFNPEGERGKGEEIVLVNPKIFKYASKRTLFTEGCLSFPQIEADVERPASVKIEAQDLKGKKFDIHLKGFEARIFQHEFDHLQSILFFDRMTPAVLETIVPALQKLEDDYLQKTGQAAPERVNSKN